MPENEAQVAPAEPSRADPGGLGEQVFLNIAKHAYFQYARGWEVELCAACALMPGCGSAEVQFHSVNADAPPWVPKQMKVPMPATELCLFIFLHEIGHIALRHGGRRKERQELEASSWARSFMRRYGVTMNPNVWEIAVRFAKARDMVPQTIASWVSELNL